MSNLFIGNNYNKDFIKESYELNYFLNEYELDNYKVKIDIDNFVENNAFISDKASLDNFTSLINEEAFTTNQMLGYNSYWMNTMSSGSNLFIDFYLGHKYLLTDYEVFNIYYKLLDKYNEYYLYEANINISNYQEISEFISLEEQSSLKNTNLISLNTFDEEVITIIEDFEFININNENNKLTIIDNNKEAYMIKTVNINELSSVYFELINSYDNKEKQAIYNSMDVYINNELIIENYPKRNDINTIYLGDYENNVEVKIVLKENIEYKDFSLGILKNSILSNYFLESSEFEYNNSKASITINSDKDKLIFIPINYLDNMTVSINGVEAEVNEVYDNFIGLSIKEGKNNIEINYETPFLRISLFISLVFLLITTIILIKKPDDKILENVIYNIVVHTLLIIVFVLPFILYIII